MPIAADCNSDTVNYKNTKKFQSNSITIQIYSGDVRYCDVETIERWGCPQDIDLVVTADAERSGVHGK